MILVLILCNWLKKNKNQPQPQVQKVPVDIPVLDEAERENLINYKIEGGQEKDEVKKKEKSCLLLNNFALLLFCR